MKRCNNCKWRRNRYSKLLSVCPAWSAWRMEAAALHCNRYDPKWYIKMVEKIKTLLLVIKEIVFLLLCCLQWRIGEDFGCESEV